MSRPSKLAKTTGVSAQTEAYCTIGELAKACDTTPRALRYYEEQGLIAPSTRSDGRYRLYTQTMTKRVNAIIALQDLGYSLSAIQQMLGSASTDHALLSKPEQIERTRTRLRHQQHELEQKLTALNTIQSSIEDRLKTLETICGVCHTFSPEKSCASQCEHHEVHQ